MRPTPMCREGKFCSKFLEKTGISLDGLQKEMIIQYVTLKVMTSYRQETRQKVMKLSNGRQVIDRCQSNNSVLSQIMKDFNFKSVRIC